MDKKIKICIFLILVLIIESLYANDKLKNERIFLKNNGLIFHVEAEYELDQNAYVSDELPLKAVYSIKVENRIMKIGYYPRGNVIQIANESTNYPPLVRQLQDGNKISFSINFDEIVKKYGCSLEDIDHFEIKIFDTLFYSKRISQQQYLSPEEIYSMKHICSSIIHIDKDDYKVYWKDSNFFSNKEKYP